MNINQINPTLKTTISASSEGLDDRQKQLAAIQSQAEINEEPLVPALGLDTEIPREDIECDVGVLMVKYLIDSLNKLSTNMTVTEKATNFTDETITVTEKTTNVNDTKKTTRNKEPPKKFIAKFPNFIAKERVVQAYSGGQCLKLSKHGKRYSLDSMQGNGAKSARYGDCNNGNHSPHETKDNAVDSNAEIEESNKMSLEDRMFALRLTRMRMIHNNKPKRQVDYVELKYHENMKRNFPGSELRTQEQQERRDKNTLAARVSRTKNKVYEKNLEEQAVTATLDNIELKRKIACARAYAYELMKKVGYPVVNLEEMWDDKLYKIFMEQNTERSSTPASSVPFTSSAYSTPSTSTSLDPSTSSASHS